MRPSSPSSSLLASSSLLLLLLLLFLVPSESSASAKSKKVLKKVLVNKKQKEAEARDISHHSYNAIGDSYGSPVAHTLTAPNASISGGYLPPPSMAAPVGGGKVFDPLMDNTVDYNLTPNINYGYHHHHHPIMPATTTMAPPLPAAVQTADVERGARFLGFLKDSTITLDASIKTSTKIPFCQFSNSPCKPKLIVQSFSLPYPRLIFNLATCIIQIYLIDRFVYFCLYGMPVFNILHEPH